MKKKFNITKPNGTILTKEVDASNEIYIAQLIKIGWQEKIEMAKKKPKKIKKSK